MKIRKKLVSSVLAVSTVLTCVHLSTAQAEEKTGKIMHISFDDVYECLYDITVNEYDSAFENSMLKDLKRLHEEYGAVFTLNCFIKSTKQSDYDIAKLPDRYRDEMKECASWLKFAFHAQDDTTRYDVDCPEDIAQSYKIFTDAVLNLTGTAESIDTVTRLGFFTGNSANIDAIRECEYGITGLLTADDERVSYYFSEDLNNSILSDNEYYDTDKSLKLIRSQKRLESIKSTSEELENLADYNGDIIEVFTHESEYGDVKARLEEYIKWAGKNNVRFGFAEDFKPEIMTAEMVGDNGEYAAYKLKMNAVGNDAKVIFAVYDKNDRITYTQVKDIASELEFAVDKNTGESVKFMLWNTLDEIEPLTQAQILSTTATEEPVTESLAITLNKTNYPLVVGNAGKTDFSDWESRGSSVQLSAVVESEEYGADDITWSSKDSSIATVSDNGKVRGRTTGFTEIYATLPDGDRASCVITVIDNVTRLTVGTLEFNTDKLTLGINESAELMTVINPKDVFNNGVLNDNLLWSSSDETVATVEEGVVKATGAGTAIIKAVSEDIGRTAICAVTVEESAESAQLNAASELTELKVGENVQLTATADIGEVVWKSENSYVADVDENGLVTAYSNSNTIRVGDDGQTVFENGITVYDEGTVNIIATAVNGGQTLTFPVKVSENEIEAKCVSLSTNKIYIAKGDTRTITATVLPAICFDKTVTWSSSDESIVKVNDSGRTEYGVCKADITAMDAGTAQIIAECEGKRAVCEVIVTEGTVKVDNVSITNAKEIDIDEVYQLEADITENASNKRLAWIATDRNIATIGDEGTLKGYKAGTLKVYAVAIDSISDTALLDEVMEARVQDEEKLQTLLDDAVYDECEITVLDSSPYLRNLHAPEEAITDNSINLLWNRASLLDTDNWKEYDVYCNGELLDTVTTLGYTAKKLDADTEYTFDVVAIDDTGAEMIRESITVQTKPTSEIVNVLDYGAVGNGRVMDTLAIQKAIDACPENGIVLLPKGYIFYSGALFLKSNMTFKVDGVLMGSPDGKDYPPVITRWEGWRKLNQSADEWANTTESLPDNHHPYASLINAGTYDEGEGVYNIENLTICGEGQINANGFRLGYNEGLNQKTGNGGWPEPMTPAMDQTVRGRAITVHNADGFYMKDVTVAYAPSWTIHPIFSKNMTFDAISVVSKGDGKTGAADDICILNGDGIDPESSSMINIFNINFITGDDAVAMKSGRNKEGNDLDRPNEYVRITDCISDGSKGGFVVGSENASGIHDILFQNLVVQNTTLSHSIWFKTYWSRGGTSEDVICRDIESSKKIDIAANYNTSTNNPADELPKYRYMTFENCNTSFLFEGLKAEDGRETTYVENITLRGCNKSGTINYGKNFEIWDTYESRWTITNSSDIKFMYSNIDESTDIQLKEGSKFVFAINLEKKTINAAPDATPEDVLSGIESLVPGAELGFEFNEDNTVLTVTSQNGEYSVQYAVQYAKVWNFAEYTDEVKTTESGFTEDYNGMIIAIANNGADSDHDKITTSGIYWRGGASEGESPRYIEYTPEKDGMLEVTGRLAKSGGRFGISTSKVVSSMKADESSTTSTSETTVRMECSAGETYYIINKARATYITMISYVEY